MGHSHPQELPIVTVYLNSNLTKHSGFFCCLFVLFLVFIYLFIYFWLPWVFVAARGLSPVVASGATPRCGARGSHWGGPCCCRARAPGRMGFSSCGTQAQQLWLVGSRAQAQ